MDEELHMSDGGPYDMDAFRRGSHLSRGLPAVSSRHDITMMANSDSTSDLLKLDRNNPSIHGEGVDFELFDIFQSTTSELGFNGVQVDDPNQFLSHGASPDIHKLRPGSSNNLAAIRSPAPLNFSSGFPSSSSSSHHQQHHMYNSSFHVKNDQLPPTIDNLHSPISPNPHPTHSSHQPSSRVTFGTTAYGTRESPTPNLFPPQSPGNLLPALEPASLFPTSSSHPVTPHTPITPLTPGPGPRMSSISTPQTHAAVPAPHPLMNAPNHNLPNVGTQPTDHSPATSTKRVTVPKVEVRSPSPTSPFSPGHDQGGISATPSSSTYSSPYYNGAASDRSTVKSELDDFDGKGGNSKSRLARKAELARASRRRKKMYVQDLEAKVKKLGAKIEELQQKQAQAKSKRLPASITREEKERKESQKQIRAQLSEITSRKTLDKETQQRLNELVRRFVQNSRERQATVDFYLDRVEDCLTPGLQVKFALWGLDQSDEFYEKPGLWSSLMSKEVGLTEAQLQVVMSKRKYVRQERRALAQCEQMLKEVREAITGHLRSLNHHIDEIQNVMTPLQLAKFYMWVENNEWCMQMLNTMFTTPSQQAAAAAAMQQASLQNAANSTSSSSSSSMTLQSTS